MCWFSVVNSETEAAQAEINQCLGIRLGIYACPTCRATDWIVPANQPSRPNPCPVCLASGTTVIFHDLPERFRDTFGLPREDEAVFEMARNGCKRLDVFRFKEGSELRLDQLTNGTRFTVISFPSQEPLSARDRSAVEEIYRASLRSV